MALPTPDTEARRKRRDERLQRENARRHWQRMALSAVASLVVLGIAFFVFSSTSGAPGAGSGAGRPSGSPSSTPTRTATAEPAPSVEPSVSKPATTTPSATATSSAPTSASAAGTAAIAALVPAPGKKTIVISKKKQLVTLYRADGTAIDRFPCATGVIYPRIGSYKVFGKRKQSWSLYDDTTFFYFTKFEVSDKGNSIGFHSIPQEPDGSLVGGLGKPISHGCVRLDKKKAKFLYEWAPIGAKVIVNK